MSRPPGIAQRHSCSALLLLLLPCLPPCTATLPAPPPPTPPPPLHPFSCRRAIHLSASAAADATGRNPLDTLHRDGRAAAARQLSSCFNADLPCRSRLEQLNPKIEMSAWHKWCSETIDRELSEELRTLTIWCALMISAFLIAATIGVVFFVRWFKLSEVMRASIRPAVR